MSTPLSWYARRLTRMSTREVAQRVGDEARRAVAVHTLPQRPGAPVPGLLPQRGFTTHVPASAVERVLPHDAAALTSAADRLLAGRWSVLGRERTDLRDPDWFLDPVSGIRAPHDVLAFRVDHRDPSVTGDVKQVWELSRHQHVTVLAAAYWLTGEEEYAVAAAAQLRSWWAANPVLRGVHWTSGIELGLRLVSWAWTRRLLDDWAGVAGLFEQDETALAQLRWHQEMLRGFPSRGSSANNHAVAETCGRLVAACAFPWFEESERWRVESGRLLRRHLQANTFPSGLNREQAADYHRFVCELAALGLVEARSCGHAEDGPDPDLVTAGLDAAAALLDVEGRPPRNGDGDEGRALLVADPAEDPWEQLLGLGQALVGAQPWWPRRRGGVVSVLVSALLAPAGPVAGDRPRPQRRPDLFEDAGVALLRTPAGSQPEIWCRCDSGPHGFGSLAAHAHADALSVELRHDGVEVLSDPGTYSYHGEARWRDYFRSTLAHNTVEVDGCDQSTSGGPFLWTQHARTYLDRAEVGDLDVQLWSAHHTGYARLDAGPAPRAHRPAGPRLGCPAGRRRAALRTPARLPDGLAPGPGGRAGAARLAGSADLGAPGGRRRGCRREGDGDGADAPASRAGLDPAPRRGGPTPGLVGRGAGATAPHHDARGPGRAALARAAADPGRARRRGPGRGLLPEGEHRCLSRAWT